MNKIKILWINTKADFTGCCFNEKWQTLFNPKIGLRSRVSFNRFRKNILRDSLSLKPLK